MQRRLNMVAVVCAVALAAAACSSGDRGQVSDPPDRGGEASTESSTTSTAAAPPTTGVVGPSYTSDIYGTLDNWLCHPDRADDSCDVDLATTRVEPDGSRVVDDVTAHPDAPIDCFYVYPTVAEDPSPNSDLDPGDAEHRVIRAQAAQYSSVCRVFAPMYRQITRAALVGDAEGVADRAMAYGDVEDAWAHYLANDNDGRGVVLIGHSQGAGHLRELLSRRIDPDPTERSLLVSAILLGTTVRTPTDAETGTHFEHLPPCSAPDQIGCIVSYSSYADDAPPGTDGFFGGVRDTVHERAVCTNPASLSGGPALSDSVLTTNPGRDSEVTTPFVRYVGIVEVECVEEGIFHYLEVRYQPSDNALRPADLGGRIAPQWGLHLLDGNIALGNLIELVEAQGSAHAER